MARTIRFSRARFAVALLGATALAVAAAPSGPARAADGTIGSSVGVTFYLPITDETGAEAAERALQTPGSASYHRFLTRAAFVRRFAASDATIAAIRATLAQLGYTVTTVFANHLAVQATAPASTVETSLGVRLETTTTGGKARMAVAAGTAAHVPAALAGMVRGVGGIESAHPARPMRVHVPLAHPATMSAAGTLTGGTPGNYLPADYAAHYDVTPLYDAGIDGRGSTIGIVTLANFHPNDAYAFWRGIGLHVSPSRVSVIDVDGGTAIAPSDALGEGETDIDVEESGGLAPGAALRVYVAPNGPNSYFIDAFEALASENLADTVSVSWGEAEVDDFAEPAIGQASETAQLDEFHDVFLEMALQGQSFAAAAGDSGPFDTVDECPSFGTPSVKSPVCNAPFAVDMPADDPLAVAAGGTTTPFTQPAAGGITLTVPAERAWGWDYIVAEAAAQGAAAQYSLADEFSVGDGGGVSSYFARPWYQTGVAGITTTKPGQFYTENTGTGAVTLYKFPSGFAGRNLPDLSTDADPYSGFQYIEEGAVQSGWGGTSFVAPQLNGVTALLVQVLGGRVGAIGPALYQLGTLTTADNAVGDNWGYAAVKGYDNATGVGTLDAARLAVGLEVLKLGL